MTSVAGVPMMNGSALLEGYVPELDATVVTGFSMLEGTIAGKAACEDLCFSGASHTCAGGVIRNPHNPAHSAGGRPAAAPRWSQPAKYRWRSAETRAARSGHRQAGVVSMV
ncbi:amidase family protein [Bradyrhizobium sp. TZ2]